MGMAADSFFLGRSLFLVTGKAKPGRRQVLLGARTRQQESSCVGARTRPQVSSGGFVRDMARDADAELSAALFKNVERGRHGNPKIMIGSLDQVLVGMAGGAEDIPPGRKPFCSRGVLMQCMARVTLNSVVFTARRDKFTARDRLEGNSQGMVGLS